MLSGQYVIHEGQPAQVVRIISSGFIGAGGFPVAATLYELAVIPTSDSPRTGLVEVRAAHDQHHPSHAFHPEMLPACREEGCRDAVPLGYFCPHLAQRAAAKELASD